MGAPRLKDRAVRTLDGVVEYARTVFECRACRCAFAPFDAEVGVLAGAKMTHSVVRKIAYAAAHSAYGPASRHLRELAGLEVSPAEFARVAQEEGERLDLAQRDREAQWNAPVDPFRATRAPERQCERLVLEADATTVLTVQKEEHKSVYCAVAFGLESRGRKGKRAFLSEKRYAASAESMEDFGERLKALAWRMGMRQSEHVAFVGDGARCLWKWAEENLPSGTVFIQDFWHVCEHLAELAQTLFGEKWRPRYARWKNALRAGRVETILGSLRRERKGARGKRLEAIDSEIGYLEAGRRRMDYPRYEREGWPIGSGAVEGACKHLVKERFCVTGARWRRKNIPQQLALRLSIFNEEWDKDWRMPEVA